MSILNKKKICKLGTGKAKGYKGCGTHAYLEWGLCFECKKNFLLNTEQGQELVLKASKKAQMYSTQVIKKNYNKEKKERKWELMSTAQKINVARKVFQKWIRNRDKDEPCISCGTQFSDLWDGGHYMKAEIYTGVIFDEVNCHRQCRKCNRFLNGNEAQYRIALCLKYGEKIVVDLENKANMTRIYRYSDDELKSIIDKYKLKKVKDK